MEINIDDLMPTEQTSEVEPVTEELEVDELEPTSEDEELELEEEPEESDLEEETTEPDEGIDYSKINIKWDDTEKPLSEYTQEDIQKYMGLGLKCLD